MSIILEPQTYSGGDFQLDIRGTNMTLEDFHSAVENIRTEYPESSLVGSLLVLNALKPGKEEFVVTIKIPSFAF